jgi:predicted glycoside hydrolase/deacetylase ChbG (UPF0249 family)
MKQVTLCADDYGLSESISQGIIDLAEKSRISAVSCITTYPHWLQYAPSLLQYHSRLDIGLHFNLTQGAPMGPMPSFAPLDEFPKLPAILMKAYCRQISVHEITEELERQLENFINATGHLPDYIDGHEHIHHLPGIRDALFTVYEKHLRSHPVYMRAATNGLGSLLKIYPGFLKAGIITLTGANTFKNSLKTRHIPHNTTFSGIYPFSKATDYAKLFPGFLKQVEEGGLVLCHPGRESNDLSDSLRQSRWFEYQYLISDQFIEDCKRAKVRIGRLKYSFT